MLSLYPIKVGFPLTPLASVEGLSLVCLRKVGSMDTARILLNLRPEEGNQYLAAGAPIVVRWYSNAVVDQFVGYVHSFKPVVEGYRQQTLVVAVSAAYPMFDEKQRVFQNVGIHNVAEAMADDYRFQLIAEKHPLVQAQILQQDDSDWAMLKRLSEQWGYAFLFEGVTMIFRPLQRVLEENYRYAEQAHTEAQPSQRPSSIRVFKPSFSAVGKTPAAGSVGEGVDPIRVRRIEWSEPGQNNVFREFDPSYPIQVELEGELAAVARDAKKRFPYTAQMIIQSPIGKKPMDVYQIAHEGERMTWVVRSVKHIVTNNDFYGQMELGTDGKDYVTEAQDRGLDVSTMIRTNSAMSRSTPMLASNRPYLSGAGASVMVSEQRWRAEVMNVPIAEGRAAS